MKSYFNIFLLFFTTTYSLLAQNADSSLTASIPDSTINLKQIQKTNALSINPLGALTGSVSGGYEHLCGQKHGLLLEGGYAFGNGYDIIVGYRYHYFTEKNESGLISPFWGFFIHKGKNSRTYEDTDKNKKYDYNIDLLTVGVHWGQRHALGGSFFYTWRIGYGYPIILNFDWSNGKPDNSSTIEGIFKLFSGIDGELSIGIVF